MSDERLGRIETIQDQLLAGQARLESHVAGLESRVTDLDRHMRVLHEDLVDRITAIADPTAMLRREIREGDAAVREDLTRRLDPLELVVRDHSATLARLRNPRRR